MFKVVIQLQTASQRKPTRYPVFYMLTRTHKAANHEKKLDFC